MHVAHIITRMIIGGAQENTLLSAIGQQRDYGDRVALITGPTTGPEGSLETRARQSGLDVRIVPPLRRSMHPWRDWQAYRQLQRLLREIRPDIVHTHSSKAGVLGRAAAWKLGLPVVHTVHGAAFHYGQNPLLHRLFVGAERWAGRRCDHFISVCDAMTEQYVAAGVAPPERFTTIYSGMEVEPFLAPPRPPEDVRRDLGFEPHHIVIGKVARLFHLKGHEFVIQAAAEVIEHNPHVRFLFVGDGLLRDRFVQEIARRGMEHCFRFTGLVPPAQVAELLAAMDVVVHTSLWEGLARVLPQALIAGKPVVSYDVDGAREVVIPGETGYLLPPQSVDELSAALIELADNPDLRTKFGQAGRARFTEQFRHETMTRRIREVYEHVLSRRNAR